MAKRQTETPSNILRVYINYLSILRREKSFTGRLPLHRQVKSLTGIEEFLIAAGLEDLNRKEAIPLYDTSEGEGFRTKLLAIIELRTKERTWPPNGFILSSRKTDQEPELGLDEDKDTEQEDTMVTDDDSKAVESPQVQSIEEEKDKITEPETPDDKEEQSSIVATKESTSPLLQEPLKKSKSALPAHLESSLETGEIVQVAAIKAWYPQEGWGHIWVSKRPWEDRDPQFYVVFKDIEDEGLRKEIERRVQEWPKKNTAKDPEFDENKVLISNPKYYSSRLVVQFYPDISEGPGNWRATKIKRYERPENERFVRKGVIVDFEQEIRSLRRMVEDLHKTMATAGIAPKDLDQKIASSVQEAVRKMTAVFQQDVERMRNRISESSREIDDAMADLFRLKQGREAEAKKGSKTQPHDPTKGIEILKTQLIDDIPIPKKPGETKPIVETVITTTSFVVEEESGIKNPAENQKDSKILEKRESFKFKLDPLHAICIVMTLLLIGAVLERIFS